MLTRAYCEISGDIEVKIRKGMKGDDFFSMPVVIFRTDLDFQVTHSVVRYRSYSSINHKSNVVLNKFRHQTIFDLKYNNNKIVWSCYLVKGLIVCRNTQAEANSAWLDPSHASINRTYKSFGAYIYLYIRE